MNTTKFVGDAALNYLKYGLSGQTVLATIDSISKRVDEFNIDDKYIYIYDKC